MTIKILLGVTLAVAAFVVWRYTSVRRGARAREEALLKRLDPIGQRLEKKAEIRPEEIHHLAASPELRYFLYQILTTFGRPQLFPGQYLSQEAQAQSALTYWLLHPNELQAAPTVSELVEKVERQVSGRAGTFYVFRYKMPAGHWAGPDWLLGLAGPFFPDDLPYHKLAGAFSRAGDKATKVSPPELVDWYLGVLKGRGA